MKTHHTSTVSRRARLPQGTSLNRETAAAAATVGQPLRLPFGAPGAVAELLQGPWLGFPAETATFRALAMGPPTRVRILCLIGPLCRSFHARAWALLALLPIRFLAKAEKRMGRINAEGQRTRRNAEKTGFLLLCVLCASALVRVCQPTG